MRVDLHAPHGRRWTIERRVLGWKPRVIGTGLLDDLPGDRWALGARSDRFRQRGHRHTAAFQGSVRAGILSLVVLPLLIVQAVAWVVSAAAVWAFREVRTAPWTIRAWSRHPKPLDHEERVVGWAASRRRVKQLALELEEGLDLELSPTTNARPSS